MSVDAGALGELVNAGDEFVRLLREEISHDNIDTPASWTRVVTATERWKRADIAAAESEDDLE
jgi:hypothetical protein